MTAPYISSSPVPSANKPNPMVARPSANVENSRIPPPKTPMMPLATTATAAMNKQKIIARITIAKQMNTASRANPSGRAIGAAQTPSTPIQRAESPRFTVLGGSCTFLAARSIIS